MQITLTRDEVLRQARAMLGIQTDNSLSTQVAEQHIVMVNMAARKVQQECQWVMAQDRVTITLGAEQNTINYPPGCNAGNIRGMAVYDESRYYPVEARIIPVQADNDQQQLAGGDIFKGVQGRPRYFEQRKQLVLWPFSDKAYPLRLDFAVNIEMPNGSDTSALDGQLIVFMSVVMIAAAMNDERMAQYAQGLYNDRKGQLMAWQSQGSRFAMSTEADLGEDEFLREDLMPNWDRNPTAAPGSGELS